MTESATHYRDAWRSAIYDATGDYVKTQRAMELAELNGLFDPVDALARPAPITQCDAESAAVPSNFTPGDPVEVRLQDDAIDEIVIRRGDVHIEQMSADSWFMGVDGSDGSYWQFWFGAKNRKSHVEFRHTETISAAENVRPDPGTVA